MNTNTTTPAEVGEYKPNPSSPANLMGPNGSLWRGDRFHGGLSEELMEAETLILANRANRANRLPAVQAQLAEAVELLEATRDYLLSNVPKGGVRKAFHELNAHACRVKAIRAFLDKVDAP